MRGEVTGRTRRVGPLAADQAPPITPQPPSADALVLSPGEGIGPFALGQGLEFVVLVGLVLILFQSLKRKLDMPWLLYGFSALTLSFVVGLNTFFPLFR
jgi:hypothetical protein